MTEIRTTGFGYYPDDLEDRADPLPLDHISRFLPEVDFAFDSYQWTDPAWGLAEIDDSWGGIDRQPDEPDYPMMFRELFLHPAIKRMIGIEQLTLPERYATIPNAANFSRWEHITGSAVLVKLLVEKWNNENPTDRVSNRELVVFMLRTMLSDIGHTIGSHVGDWIMGDADEKEHDEQLMDYIKANGIDKIIESYGIQLSEVILTEVDEDDFVERLSPYLCIDRVDYAVREIHRTNRYFDDPDKRFTIDDFRLIKDDKGILQLVMDDPGRALLFAKTYELLPKEDWAEPFQRLQTTVYTDMVKLLLIAVAKGIVPTLVSRVEVLPYGSDDHDEPWISEFDRHPRDVLMYAEGVMANTIDLAKQFYANKDRYPTALTEEDAAILKTISDLDYTMRSLSTLVKEYYVNERQAEVTEFTQSVDDGTSHPNTQIHDRSILGQAQKVTLEPGRTIGFSFATSEEDDEGYTVTLPPRKKRSVNPIVIQSGTAVPLSELPGVEYIPNNDAYRAWTAEINSDDPSIMTSLEQTHEIISKEWEGLLTRPRLPAWQVKAIQDGALTGLIAATDYAVYTKQAA